MTTLFTILLRLAAVCFAALIAWQSLLPPGDGGGILHMDKVLHFLSYAVLTSAVRLGWPTSNRWTVFGICVAFGISIEIAQGTMGLGRTASVADVLANTAGAWAGLWLTSLWLTRKKII